MHRCINCGTTFTRRSSLLRHEKDRCKRGIYHHGSNIKHDIFDTNRKRDALRIFQSGKEECEKSNNINFTEGGGKTSIPTLRNHNVPPERLNRKYEDIDESEDEIFDPLDQVPANDSQEIDKYSVDNRDWLWVTLIEMTANEVDFLGVLKHFIAMDYKSQSDTLFNAIMMAVIDTKSRCKSWYDAVKFVLDKNKNAIIASVNNCRNDESNSIWCKLAKKSDGVACKWFSGKSCYCRSCGGTSIFGNARTYLLIFIAMMKDELIEKIDVDIEDMKNNMEIQEAIDRALDRYRGKYSQNIMQLKNLI